MNALLCSGALALLDGEVVHGSTDIQRYRDVLLSEGSSKHSTNRNPDLCVLESHNESLNSDEREFHRDGEELNVEWPHRSGHRRGLGSLNVRLEQGIRCHSDLSHDHTHTRGEEHIHVHSHSHCMNVNHNHVHNVVHLSGGSFLDLHAFQSDGPQMGFHHIQIHQSHLGELNRSVNNMADPLHDVLI